MKGKVIIAPVIIILTILIASLLFTIKGPSDASIQYFCNQKMLSWDLNIDVENGMYKIDGELFSTYEDDLAMTNKGGDLVRKTDDQYNFITQNNHAIYDKDGNVLYGCNGKFKLFADSYEVVDKDGEKVATVNFNMFDTVGVMRDNNGNIIARYDSALWRKDYIVSIYDGCTIDDESILMIFASYVSDVRADNQNDK
mgnify:CR=1 FL=1